MNSDNWITEEEMYPNRRITEYYEDTEELELFDYWEDFNRENSERTN